MPKLYIVDIPVAVAAEVEGNDAFFNVCRSNGSASAALGTGEIPPVVRLCRTVRNVLDRYEAVNSRNRQLKFSSYAR